MAGQSNPRKVTTSGGMIVVSLPKDDFGDYPIEVGDQVTLEPTDDGFEAQKVEWQVSSDE